MTNLLLRNCVRDPWKLLRNNGFNSARKFSVFSKVWGLWDNLLLAWDQAPHCGKKEKKISVGEKKSVSKVSWEVVWGEERVVEPGDLSLMPTIHPPAINLLLKCQDVKFSSRMSAWVYYVLGAQGLAVRKMHSLPISTDFWVLSRFW